MGFALEKQSFVSTIKFTNCCACGTPIGMESTLYDALVENHHDFCCPLGHAQHFNGTTEAQRLREELERRTRALLSAQNDVARERNLRMGAQRKTSRLKKRIANGVCPCCKRSFENLRRHIETKHPEMTKKEPTTI